MFTSLSRARFWIVLLVTSLFGWQAETLDAAGLKLPSTWDYAMGFTQAGTEALRTIRDLRGNRAWSPGRNWRYRHSYNSHSPGFRGSHHYVLPYDPDPPHYYQFVPNSPAYYAPPVNRMPSNPAPDFGPRVGEIRRVDRYFDPTRASAIVNPDSTDFTLRYLLDGEPVELPPGHYQVLGAGRSWKIEFDRGGSFGQKRYSIGNGLYTFTPTSQGWELHRRPE